MRSCAHPPALRARVREPAVVRRVYCMCICVCIYVVSHSIYYRWPCDRTMPAQTRPTFSSIVSLRVYCAIDALATASGSGYMHQLAL